MRSLRAMVLVLLTAPALSACWPLGVATTAADFGSLNTTKKTLGDHVVSGVTGRDCSILSLEESGQYCPERVVVDRSNVYCYRTLADVNCHYIPDPYKNGHTALASPPPVRKPIQEKGWFD
ncbi:hypothetical protein [Azospirillum sp.]|uniref:hypothetical protein n=1 Tax=Azospirillum sp. TaxID=34012 RepID=UPI002D69B924|nr:hypothetical protein [Azospirillum sp.]HYD64878.1 hypothetical protein [Azospirillum sp.]